MSHEQSETIQLPSGKWTNVYGRRTQQAGTRLPNERDYDTVEEAVEAAKKRSREATRLPVKGYARGGLVRASVRGRRA